MVTRPKNTRALFLALFCSAVLYVLLGYFITRDNSAALFPAVGGLFLFYLLIVSMRDRADIKHLLLSALLLRLLLAVAFPALSDDYFRFIWDGQLTAHGYNPFNYLPSEIPGTAIGAATGLQQPLFSQLNSPEYYSIYPPVLQAVFGGSALLGGQSILAQVMLMRGLILLAECSTLYFGLKLLRKMDLPEKNIVWYAFNPLVIIELTGNLHFEALVLGLLTPAIWLLYEQRWKFSALLFGLAVSAKLIPLLFLPFLIRRIGWLKTMLYGLFVGTVFIVLFLPFVNQELISNFFSSIDLYFRKFEFNASLYYITRWVGFQVTGYNIIQFTGPVFALVTCFAILFLAWKERTDAHNPLAIRSFFRNITFALLIYYLLATTVHPWYATLLVFAGSFAGLRFPLFWSAVIFVSYFAYQQTGFKEHGILIALEYLLVAGVLFYDLRIIRQDAKS